MLIDQHIMSRDAIYVDFFDRPAATTSAVAALALRTGAPVVPVFALPLGGGRYRMIYEHPVEPPDARRRARRPRVHAAVHRRARDVRPPPSGAVAVDAPALARRPTVDSSLGSECRGCFLGRMRKRSSSTVELVAAIGMRQPVPNARSVTFRPGAACLRLNSAPRTRRSTRLNGVGVEARGDDLVGRLMLLDVALQDVVERRRTAAASPDRSGSGRSSADGALVRIDFGNHRRARACRSATAPRGRPSSSARRR